MANNGTISIQTEALANIRQTTMSILLPSPANSSSLVETSADGSLLCISHNNTTQTLELPARVVPTKKPVQIVPNSTHSLIRLPLAPGFKAVVFRAEDQDVPWTAVDLVVGSQVGCRACDAILVAPDTIGEWKDLPSENWAEMMEFWHCHKPVAHDDNDDEDNATVKAYGANSSISSQPGIGFADLTSFMFYNGDCQNLQYEIPCTSAELDLNPSQNIRAKANPVYCAACKCEIGFASGPGSVNLFKWQVKCQTNGQWAPPRVTELLSAALLATVSRTGTTKSLVMSRYPVDGNGPDTVLHLWIINNNVVHNSTARPERVTAMKVGFSVITRELADNMLSRMSLDLQEVNLPQDAIAECLAELEAIHQTMAPTAREFRGFHISFLRRWVEQVE